VRSQSTRSTTTSSTLPGIRCCADDDAGHGLKIDLDPAGTPIGVEITAPSLVSAADVNAALAKFGAGAIDPAELAPLAA
jgi:hypothetical protein